MARPVELFLPATRLVARQWLQECSWDVKFCLQVIFHVSCLQNEQLAEKAPKELSANAILEVAESTGLTKNAEWHRRIAMSLLELSHLQEAEEHYRAAMDLDSQNWLAPAGLGGVEKIRGRNEEAIRLMRLGSEILEGILESQSSPPTQDQKNDLARRYEDVAETALTAGDREMALTFYKKSLDLTMGRHWCMCEYLRALHKDDDVAEIVRVFKTMDVKIEETTMEYATYLRAFVYSNGDFIVGLKDFWKVAAAFKSRGEIEWLQNVYRALIVAARKDQLPIVEFALSTTLADLFYVYDDKEDKAMQIWKTVLQFPSTFMNSDKSLKYLHNYIGKVYAQCQIQRAFQAGIDTPEADKYIKLLEEICVNTDSLLANLPEYYVLLSQNLVLGIWKVKTGERKTGAALLRPFMQLAVNDAYRGDKMGTGVITYMIAKMLIGYGDEARAASLIQKYTLPGNPAFICQGRCGVMDDRWEKGYTCKVCSMDLCVECAEILKQGKKLPMNVCSPDHSWVYFEGLDTAPKEGEICFEGEMISMSQFYQDLRKDWQL